MEFRLFWNLDKFRLYVLSSISPDDFFWSNWDLYNVLKSSSIRAYVTSLMPYSLSYPPVSMISLSFADEHDVNRVVTAVLAIIAVATERKVLVFLDNFSFMYTVCIIHITLNLVNFFGPLLERVKHEKNWL